VQNKEVGSAGQGSPVAAFFIFLRGINLAVNQISSNTSPISSGTRWIFINGRFATVRIIKKIVVLF
jgi:hypothetical protein